MPIPKKHFQISESSRGTLIPRPVALVPKFVSTFEPPKSSHLWLQGPGISGLKTPPVTAACRKLWKPLPYDLSAHVQSTDRQR